MRRTDHQERKGEDAQTQECQDTGEYSENRTGWKLQCLRFFFHLFSLRKNYFESASGIGAAGAYKVSALFLRTYAVNLDIH